MFAHRIRFAITILAVAAALVLLFAFRGPLLRSTAAGAIDVATGYQVSFAGLTLGAQQASVRGLHVSRAGEPVLDADSAVIGYRLRDLLPGGARRYGLRSIALERPTLHLVRHADGSFNISGASSGAPPASPAPGATPSAETPLAFTATVHDGSVQLVDPNRVLPNARALGAEGIDATATVDTAARTSYALTGNVAGAAPQRFEARGRIDAGGYSIHRLRAATLAVAPVADYFINTRSAEVLAGTARDVDVRVYSFGPKYHIYGSGTLEGGSIHLPGFIVPVTGMQGRIDVTDDALLAPALEARIGALAVRVTGGLYDRESPAFRLGIVAPYAPLEEARALFNFSRRLDLRGDARLETLLESSVGSPLVATTVVAPAIAYRAYPIDRVSGRAVYYDSAVDVVGATGTYGGLDARINGAIELGDQIHTALVAGVNGPAARVPYVAQIAPFATVHANALLAGVGLRFDVRGAGDGAGGGTTLSGVFHVDPDGDGAFGPLAVTRTDGGSAAGAFYLHRIASESGFWLDARDYPFARLPGDPRLPGVALAPPVFGARLNGSLAGVGPPSDFRIAGTVRARDLVVGDLHIDDVRGNLGGRFGVVRLGAIAASGPWGAFSGSGAYRGDTLALQGNYRGGFAQLRTFTGDLGGRGPVDGPVALLISPDRTVVQARGDGSPGATVHGVPVDQLRGTLAVVHQTVRVYAATARVANGTFAAAGTADAQRGIGVSLAGAEGGRLHAIAPLGGGEVAAIGDVHSNARTTRFDGGIAVADSSLDRLPLQASGDLSLEGTRIDVRDTDAVLGAGVASLAGSVDGLGTRAAQYDVGVHLTALRVASFARAMYPNRHDIAGTLAGDAHVSGTQSALTVTGALAMPEGTVNGLAFRDVATNFAVTPGGIDVHGGHVTVGTTLVNFGGNVAGSDAGLRVDAPAADLSDFNDYFDTGDTLAGKGRIDFAFRKRAESVSTGAGISIAALRYRRFDLGDATAWWTSRGPDVSGKIAFGGTSGRLALAGTIAVLPAGPRAPLVDRLRANGTAQLRGLDLGVWLPALGYDLPVSGHVDADATIAGPLRDPDMQTTFTMLGGTLGRFPVNRLDVATTSTLDRTTITHATIDLPGVSANASGSFGLRPRDPLSLALHLKSPDIGALAAQAAGLRAPLTGAAEVDVKVDGTSAHPRVAGGFDLEGATLAGVQVPQALGEFTVAGRDIVLSDAELGFAKGTLYLAGSVPLEVAPFGFGPASAPITLDFNAKAIDLANFAPLLPTGSTLEGLIDGHVAIGGTAGNPRLDGALSLASGAFRAPIETVPLQNIAAKLVFNDNVARLESLHAAAAGGTLDATGNVRFVDLVRPGVAASYQLQAKASRLALALPQFGSGVVDGTLSLAHTPETIPRLQANLALSDATIPFNALLLLGGFSSNFSSGLQAAQVPADSDFALDLDLAALRNVRVRSANVDIGARGELHVGGTRAAPVLDGGFDSAGGGTLSYFNTVFRVIDGQVTFAPELGVIPNLDAHAVTHVPNPDPNTVRNITGSADVTLDIHGPVTNLSIALSSDPSYDRQQILGLLLNAPALGANTLFGTSGQATLYGSTNSNLPPGVVAGRNANGEFSVAQEAFGIANAQFTRTLLSPIESSVAEAVGLTNIAVNVDYSGQVGLTARKTLGKKVNAIYGSSFGYPYRQTFGFEIKPNDSEAAQVTVFQTLGAYGLNSLTPVSFLSPTNLKVQAAEPSQGTAGFSLSLQKLF